MKGALSFSFVISLAVIANAQYDPNCYPSCNDFSGSPIQMSAGQATMAAPGVRNAPAGGGVTTGTAGAATTANPQIDSVARGAPPQQPASNASGSDPKKNQFDPSQLGNALSGLAPKSSGNGSGSGSGSGSCPNCPKAGDAYKKSIDNVEQQLAGVNKNDGKTASIIGEAENQVAAAQKSDVTLDQATAKLKDAKSKLGQALKQIKTQNDDDATKLRPLPEADQKRQDTISSVVLDPESSECTDKTQAAASDSPGTSGTNDAGQQVSAGQQAVNTALQLAGSVAGIPAALTQYAQNLAGNASLDGIKLGVSNLASAAQSFQEMAAAGNTYQTAATSAGHAGQNAVTAVSAANSASNSAKSLIDSTKSKSDSATQTVSQNCTQINGKPSAAASLLLTAMTTAETPMPALIQQSNTAQQTAVSSYNQAMGAVRAFGAWVSSSGTPK